MSNPTPKNSNGAVRELALEKYTVCPEKVPTFKLALTLSNLNRFSKKKIAYQHAQGEVVTIVWFCYKFRRFSSSANFFGKLVKI